MKNLVDAQRSFVFAIQPEDVKDAKRHDKEHCVIANALCATPGIKKVEVGARFTRIWGTKAIHRYMTDKVLRVALNEFDHSGQWNLPVGVYEMRPPTPGRTLKNEKHYDATVRTPAQINNKKRKNPEKKGSHVPRPMNPRVIEFAKIRKDRES